ncbi:MAG TPA: hypothetical protein VF221_01695 [Chloroflexota bacterium]
MRHLGDGTLRRIVDEPLAIADSERRHLTACSTCHDRYVDIAAQARDARMVLDLPSLEPDVPAALAHMRSRLATSPPAGKPARLNALRLRRSVLRQPLAAALAAAALVGAVALTPAGSLAQSFITVFQPKEVAAVPLTPLDVKSLAQLRHYGTYHVPANVPNIQVPSATDASRQSSMKVLVPSSVPAGIPTQVSYSVSPGGIATFTFSASKARAWAAKAGKTLPAMPARVDGSTLQVAFGSTVVATYGACGPSCSDIPPLVIGQTVAPRVSSTRAGLAELEDYVLGLPGVSPQLAAQIRSIGAPASTLPIPIPAGMAHTDSVTVQGVHGLAIGDQTGVGSLVVWEKDGIIYAVGGPQPESQVISIANSLQ